jgi:hypothetical protein
VLIDRRSRIYASVSLLDALTFQAPPVQYYFNPARTKAHQYPWLGIQQYGPFSKDTFPKRSPTILTEFVNDLETPARIN